MFFGGSGGGIRKRDDAHACGRFPWHRCGRFDGAPPFKLTENCIEATEVIGKYTYCVREGEEQAGEDGVFQGRQWSCPDFVGPLRFVTSFTFATYGERSVGCAVRIEDGVGEMRAGHV